MPIAPDILDVTATQFAEDVTFELVEDDTLVLDGELVALDGAALGLGDVADSGELQTLSAIVDDADIPEESSERSVVRKARDVTLNDTDAAGILKGDFVRATGERLRIVDKWHDSGQSTYSCRVVA